MDSRTNVEVLILGKVYTLSGYESEEYLQKIASYINNKMAEYNKIDSFKKLSMDYQSVLMQVNLADDYFKAKKQVDVLEEEIKAKEKELYDLKHELISYQIKMENMEKTVKNLNSDLNENAKKIIRLETELQESRKNS
ncbi:MAG: cell division protein ZapA [Lachnospiraceae bacterium]|nr:cell division protein ZapA [Lachnospiraceae bacterium]